MELADLYPIWIIVKSTDSDSLYPYIGSECKAAGVKPGLTYGVFILALEHAWAMARHNSAGFTVKKIMLR